jgi:integrase
MDVAEAYWPAAAKGLHGGRKRPKSPKTIAIEKMRWKKHIAPVLGDRPYADLRRSDIKGYMRGLAVAGALAADSIGSIGGTLSSILAFGVHEDLIESNPATGLTKPLATRTRTRMFSEKALATIWRSLVASSSPRVRGEDRPDLAARLEPATALALRLALLTLCRRNEIAGARGGRSMKAHERGRCHPSALKPAGVMSCRCPTRLWLF